MFLNKKFNFKSSVYVIKWKKQQSYDYCFFYYLVNESNYLPSDAFFASLFSLKFSQIVPPIQYGTTNVNKNINNQNPAVKINMNKTNPEN